MPTRFFSWTRSLHAWLGAALSLLLLLISVTGTVLVWKQSYLKLVFPEARVEFVPSPAALSYIGGAVERQFPRDEVVLIEFATESFALTKVTLTDNRYAYLDTNGRIVTQWTLNERPEEWLFDLHHRLLLGTPGLRTIGYAGWLFIPIVLLGLISFWPMRRGITQGWWPQNTARRHLLGSHRNFGLLVALPLLMSASTGITLAFPEQSVQWLLEPFRGENYSLDFAEQVDTLNSAANGEWLPALQRAQQIFPHATIRSAQIPNQFSGYRVIGLQQAGEWNPLGQSKIYIDANSGIMDIRIDSQAQHVSERMLNAGYALHTGRTGSVLYQCLLTLAGVLMALLSAIGFLAFVKRFKRV